MIYFIPAWYQQNNWYENEQSWHVRRMHTEFDDTVKQVQLFHRSGAYPYRIMLLGFSPNFRHFLHRQSVYRAPYWSCFDAIQEIRRGKARLLSVHNLSWPAGVEFIYTPFVLVAMLDGEKYAQVEYGEDGNPIRIDMYENGRIHRRNIYDDRGFLSASIVYEDGNPVYQDYLMESGSRKLRCFLQDGHVEINSSHPNYLLNYEGTEYTKRFSKQIYESLEEVIDEVLSAYLTLTKDEDLFCAAMHERHTDVLLDALYEKKLILSFFKERYDLNSQPRGLELMKKASYIITDSRENSREIRGKLGHAVQHITDITPFDTRMDTGINLQFSVQKILVPVDGMPEERFAQIVKLLGNYFASNANARVCLFTREADYNRKGFLLEKTRKILKEVGMPEGWALEEVAPSLGENKLEDEKSIPVKFVVEQCVEELAVSMCLKEQRVIADLRDVPELYLQIMAVSIGIPQIVLAENQFARHGKNGYAIQDLSKLPEALVYYLDGMANWNDAQVHSYKLGKKYTTSVLLAKWKEVIESVE